MNGQKKGALCILGAEQALLDSRSLCFKPLKGRMWPVDSGFTLSLRATQSSQGVPWE